MNFDFKITTWERVTAPEEMQQEIFEAIKSGNVTSANDIFNIFPNDDLICDTIHDVSEQMTIESNDFNGTIEVLEDRKTIWDNTPKTNHSKPTIIIKNVDLEMLKKQKLELLKIANKNSNSEIDGIINMIDAIQDYAQDTLGIKVFT